jgi:general stress protein YciG
MFVPKFAHLGGNRACRISFAIKPPTKNEAEMAQSKAPKPSKRGFSAMDENKQHDIASKGWHSVPPDERSFIQDHKLAAEAGRKGGKSVPSEERSFSKDHELASQAGPKGRCSGTHEQHVKAGHESHKGR